MYGLPEDFDLGTFVGLEFESVTFSPNTIHLAFSGQHSITVIGRLSYQLAPGAALLDDVLPVADSRLPALLGQSVERAELHRPGGILLHFESGGMLLVDDHEEHYESYSVKTPAGERFV